MTGGTRPSSPSPPEKKRPRLFPACNILLWGLAVIIISCGQPPPVPPEPFVVETAIEYKHFLPMTGRYARGECRDFQAGIAWLDGRGRQRGVLKDFCSFWWYSYKRDYSRPAAGEIPLLWCDRDDRTGEHFDPVAWNIAGSPNKGPVIVLNEPDNPDQCNRGPVRSAEIVRHFETILGDRLIVTPNLIINEHRGWEGWLSSFLRSYVRFGGKLDKLIIGVHFYEGDQPIRDRLDAVCGIMRNLGQGCRIWVTEFGGNMARSDAYDQYRQWIADIRGHSAVERYFGYTWWSRGTDGGLRDWTDGDWRVTLLGDAWQDSHRK